MRRVAPESWLATGQWSRSHRMAASTVHRSRRSEGARATIAISTGTGDCCVRRRCCFLLLCPRFGGRTTPPTFDATYGFVIGTTLSTTGTMSEFIIWFPLDESVCIFLLLRYLVNSVWDQEGLSYLFMQISTGNVAPKPWKINNNKQHWGWTNGSFLGRLFLNSVGLPALRRGAISGQELLPLLSAFFVFLHGTIIIIAILPLLPFN